MSTIGIDMPQSRLTAISLFTSGEIGDLALREAGFDILASNEKLADRHAVFHRNFPETAAITGDIWEKAARVEEVTRARLGDNALTLFYATPPCQGMSKNGRGKLLSAIRAGRKPPMDERNRLIIPTIELAKRLKPEILFLENVPEIADTVIVNRVGEAINLVEFIQQELGPEYEGRAQVVELRRVRSGDTRPELLVRSLLRLLGYRYRLRCLDLPGRPDIVMRGRRRVVFVHGCFWHRHHCGAGRSCPATNVEFWQEKFERPLSRDRKQGAALRRAGWGVLVVWERQLRDQQRVLEKLRRFVAETWPQPRHEVRSVADCDAARAGPNRGWLHHIGITRSVHRQSERRALGSMTTSESRPSPGRLNEPPCIDSTSGEFVPGDGLHAR